jgi:hypothetical protein
VEAVVALAATGAPRSTGSCACSKQRLLPQKVRSEPVT